MWMQYFKEILVPTLQLSNETHKRQTTFTDGTRMRIFFSSDGEDIVLSNIYEQELLDLFEMVPADYVRVGAGSTGIL